MMSYFHIIFDVIVLIPYYGNIRQLHYFYWRFITVLSAGNGGAISDRYRISLSREFVSVLRWAARTFLLSSSTPDIVR